MYMPRSTQTCKSHIFRACGLCRPPLRSVVVCLGEIRIMDQRLQFLSGDQKKEMSVADLCRAYGILGPTAYRWIDRCNETGPEGLFDRSSRPHSCSHATLEPIENTILVLRAKHSSWGARKLAARLETLQPDVVWPAASTFGNILSRAGLTSSQKKRKRITPCSEPFSLVMGPNRLWKAR